MIPIELFRMIQNLLHYGMNMDIKNSFSIDLNDHSIIFQICVRIFNLVDLCNSPNLYITQFLDFT